MSVTVHVEGADLGPPDELDRVTDQEREPDRHQQELQQPGAARSHRAPHDLLEEDGQQSSGEHAEHDAEHQRAAPGDVHEERHVGTEREEVAVGEVDQLQDPVDERQADRAERVHRAEREPVEAGLGDVVQAVPRDQDQHADSRSPRPRCTGDSARPAVRAPFHAAARAAAGVPRGQRSRFHGDGIPAFQRVNPSDAALTEEGAGDPQVVRGRSASRPPPRDSGTLVISSPRSAAMRPNSPAVDQLRRLDAVAGGQHAVGRGRRAAALHVAERRDARLEAGALPRSRAPAPARCRPAAGSRTGRSRPRRGPGASRPRRTPARRPSATTTIEKPLPRRWRALIAPAISSTVSSSSGITIASAPPAMPLKTAIQPVLRPITSITITRSCDWAVVCRRSIASVAICTAVSKPNV